MYIYIILYNIFNVYTIYLLYIIAYVTPLPQVLYHSFISGFGAQRDELTGGGGSTGGGMWDAQIHCRRCGGLGMAKSWSAVWTSLFLIVKSTISMAIMAIFNSYVSLPEGIVGYCLFFCWLLVLFWDPPFEVPSWTPEMEHSSQETSARTASSRTSRSGPPSALLNA